MNHLGHRGIAATQASEGSSIRELIEHAMKRRHPTTVGQLSRIINSENSLDESDFIQTLEKMVEDGSVRLQAPRYELESVLDYLSSPALSSWFWETIVVSAAAVIAIMLTPDVYPVNTIRWALGSVFVLYLPGYALLRLLREKAELDGPVRVALSIGLSIVVVFLLGMLINFTPWGIRLIPIIASLGAFTILCSAAAALREYLTLS